MENIQKDLVFAFRRLLKRPAFTLVAMISVALAVGANSAIFSVLNAVVLRSLPFSDSDRLVKIWDRSLKDNSQRSISYPNFLSWRQQTKSFDDMSAVYPISFSLTGGNEPEAIGGELVSASYFPILKVEAQIGRTFLPEEDQTPNSHAVTVISHDLWERRFGGDTSVVGKTVILNDNSYTIVGVMPSGFRGMKGDAQIWIPLMMVSAIRPVSILQNREASWHEVIARLKLGVTLAQAQSEMNTITAQLSEAYPNSNADRGALLISLNEMIFGKIEPVLFILTGAVAFVLLIACANIANLLLARSFDRKREIALRIALGATRRQLIQQLLTESVLLSVIGGMLGLFLAYSTIDFLVGVIPVDLPGFVKINIDLKVLGFSLLLSVLTGLIFGLAPALESTNLTLTESLKEGGRNSGSPTGGRRIRSLLIVSEVALVLVLLIGAGLMIKSFQRIQAINTGFNPDKLLTMRLNLPSRRYTTTQAWLLSQRLMESVEGLPGIQSASISSDIPLGGVISATDVEIEGMVPASSESEIMVYQHRAAPKFFSTMGASLRQGRDFTAQDNDKSQRVMIVDESFAKRYWSGEDPVGKRVRLGGPDGPWVSVVGVVGDMKHRGLPENPDRQSDIYLPLPQSPSLILFLIVRTLDDQNNTMALLRSEVQKIDPNLPVFNIATMNQRMSNKTSQPRFGTLLLGILSSIALVLAVVGIYGVMSYSVTQRSHEIGVRMAIGAQPGDILKLIISQGMKPVLLGLIIGLTGGFILTRLLVAFLYNVSATDPLIFAATPLALIGVALAACYFPARRATKVDPIIALRYQ